jgi:hypothetical protein
MFMDVMRVDEDADITVMRTDNGASIMFGHYGYLRLTMAELANLKYEIDATIMTGDESNV